MKIFFALLCALSLVWAEDLDELLEEFGQEVEIKAEVEEMRSASSSWLEFRGDYTFATAYNYQEQAYVKGVSRLRNTLNLIFDMEFTKNWKSKIEFKTLYDPLYEWDNRPNFTKRLQHETELKEAYLQGTMGQFDLKIGRQITVWGKSDNIRITDVINPLDNREIGMVDIEDLRLAVNTSKLSYFMDDIGLNFLVIHEARVQKEADVGSEFFQTSMFPSGFTVPGVIDPQSDLNDPQYAFSIDGTFSGWDLSLYSAKVLDQKWYINQGSRIYKMIKMNGLALNVAMGSWMFKSEAAFLEGIRYNTTTKEKKRLDALLGLEYKGISDVTLSLEVANRHIYEYESQMFSAADFVRADEVQTAARASYTFDHDNATLTYLISMLGEHFQDGGIQRFWLEYRYNDSVILGGGFIDYISGEKPYFEAISYNDRLFFDIKYSF